jgi:hypothetical protein
MTLRFLPLVLCAIVLGCAAPAASISDAVPPSAPFESAGERSQPLPADTGYRLDQQGLVVVHLRGTEAEIEQASRNPCIRD